MIIGMKALPLDIFLISMRDNHFSVDLKKKKKKKKKKKILYSFLTHILCDF